jgi:hypothetical protein
MNPHMKNNTVMIANGPRYVGPLLEVEDEETVVVAEGMVAISVQVVFYFTTCAIN